jgi:hypothetical protein
LVTVVGPRTHPVLYPRDATPKAVPKYISGRTSYLRVRLAFHRYPQLIRAVFNRHRCGPPAAVRPPSPWPWVDHSVSGRRPATNFALFRLGFPTAARVSRLTLLLIVTRRFILQKARRQASRSYSPPTACRQPVSGSISLPSRGAFHLSLTVLVHYRWQRVFSLRRWSSGIHPGFLVSRVTRVACAESDACHLRDCHPLWCSFPEASARQRISYSGAALPHGSRLP